MESIFSYEVRESQGVQQGNNNVQINHFATQAPRNIVNKLFWQI